MKILIIDTYYPEFLKTLRPIDMRSVYAVELRRVLDYGFGTADFYSHALQMLGWETFDCVGNYQELQRLWLLSNAFDKPFAHREQIARAQIIAFDPDVIFLQDLSFFDAATLQALSSQYLLAGQTSCRLPSMDMVSKFHVLFSSFPFYPELLRGHGVRAEYLPLAFDPRMQPAACDRDIDISFVGGVGRESHWKEGTDALEMVAARFGESFHWYGYGIENLPIDSALRRCHRGWAWGRDMYSIYNRSKIVINRHGEVAEGYANNLRMFEATGCGALLFTERAPNLKRFFNSQDSDIAPTECIEYESAHHLIELLNYYLLNRIFEVGEDPVEISAAGNARTMVSHNYDQRMKIVSDVLEECVTKSRSK